MTATARTAEAANGGTPYIPAAERERQRVAHLVLGADRPPPVRVGRGRSKRRIPVVLAPDIERALDLRERWSHKRGTPETLEHAARTREGSLARLYQSGAIDAEQLAAAGDIADVVERIGADVAVGTASLETRVDRQGRPNDSLHLERVGRVRREMAYTRWRAQTAGPIAALLEMIVHGVGFTTVARRHGMHHRRARRLLIAALDLWPVILGTVCKEVDQDTLAAAHARLLA